jgi:hypothetical protein
MRAVPGQRSLEHDRSHWYRIPGILLFVFIVPGLIAKKLITQRRKGHLYPTQAKYEPRWTLLIQVKSVPFYAYATYSDDDTVNTVS